MKYITADQLRTSFLEFFQSKDHQILPSASLVPHGDASLLLTGAGMVPFKPYFLGQEEPEHRRVTTCQRCLRTPDLENVGKTDRHGTFFEMLGNFSFGDYFKSEAIAWAWEFITEHMELESEKLWASVYLDDDEAYQIWSQEIGLPESRIVRLGKEDNFWEIGVGYPCGPCSEIHYDRGAEYGCGDPNCQPGCECERFMEIWNLVFIEYLNKSEGVYEPLAAKSIDTGMGMERIAALMQGVKSIFEIDLIRPIMDKVAGLAATSYGKDPELDVSLRVITDHVRSFTFMISDGILPSNEGRGYVLRRLLRRASRHGRILGIKGEFLNEIVSVVIKQMQVGYPELVENETYIQKVVSLEEQRFIETLDQGLSILEDLIKDLEETKDKVISGEDAFKLYDTYGFPMELTREILAEHGFTVDEAGFKAEMESQRSRARAARNQSDYQSDQVELFRQLRTKVESTFVGYQQTEVSTEIIKIIKDGQLVDQLDAGDAGLVILSKTPFYTESGGQTSDTGTITTKTGQFTVNDVLQPVEGLISHQGKVVSGELVVGDQVLAAVYAKERTDTARHHSATHLLHKVLRDTLGEHVHQAGSVVDPQRLRFDFTHFEALTEEQLQLIETKVNEAIMANQPVTTELLNLNEAKAKGALALFGEKYGESVRVVSMGDSLELCGGTHVNATGEIGLFRITSESSIAAGVRRIEAVCGKRALEYTDRREKALQTLSKLLEVPVDRAVEQLEKMLKQQKELQLEINEFKRQAVGDVFTDLVNDAITVNGVNVVVAEVDLNEADQLRSLGDRLRDQLSPAFVLLGSRTEDKVLLVAMASKEVAGSLVHAGNIIKNAAKICGGGGGGRPDMAQAGGRLPEKLPEALTTVRSQLVEQLEEN